MKHRAGVLSALENPETGIGELWKLLERDELSGDVESFHATADVLLPLLIERNRDMDKAQRVAEKLVALSPDFVHLRLLAIIHEIRGNQVAASELNERAKHAPNEHASEETLKRISET